MKRAFLALWGVWRLAIGYLAWPAGSRAYASGTADGGMLALLMGFSVRWPGLAPQVGRDGRWEDVPLS